MERFKIENWERLHLGTPFPAWRSLSEIECYSLRARLLARVGLPNSTDSISVLGWFESNAEKCEGFDAEEKTFDLCTVLSALAVQPKSMVYVNWYRFDDIDAMDAAQLSRHFGDVWYPAVDDVEIFDDSLDWVLMVHHSGSLKLARLGGSDRR